VKFVLQNLYLQYFHSYLSWIIKKSVCAFKTAFGSGSVRSEHHLNHSFYEGSGYYYPKLFESSAEYTIKS
jgi:hypothetical protein